jgi:ABC-type branched-subunit amino acid transport system substrate-binding protein
MGVLATMPAAAQSSGEKPKATEIGVSASEIHIAVVADVDNALAPGIFKGAVDGVKAGATYVNSKAGGGGLAGRKLVVDFYDSKLNPNEARNATIKACQNDIAMVGGIVLFLTATSDIVNCADQAGKATGIPDMPATAVSTTEACSPVTFATLGSAIDCSTLNANPQTYRVQQGSYRWHNKQEKGGLHGPMLIGNDTKDAAAAQTAIALGAQAGGIKADPSDVIPRSARDPQSSYTNVVAQMKSDGANYALSTSAVTATSAWLQEARLQGLDMSKIVWDNVSAYGSSDVASNASVWDGMYQSLNLLPFEEAKYNKTLAAFVKTVKAQHGELDTFSAYGFESVLAFRDAVSAVVAKHGVNGLTRANLIEGIKSLTNFNADGMAGTRSYKNGQITGCFVVVRFVNGKWVRQYPTKMGTFDCKPSNLATIKANLTGG